MAVHSIQKQTRAQDRRLVLWKCKGNTYSQKFSCWNPEQWKAQHMVRTKIRSDSNPPENCLRQPKIFYKTTQKPPNIIRKKRPKIKNITSKDILWLHFYGQTKYQLQKALMKKENIYIEVVLKTSLYEFFKPIKMTCCNVHPHLAYSFISITNLSVNDLLSSSEDEAPHDAARLIERLLLTGPCTLIRRSLFF